MRTMFSNPFKDLTRNELAILAGTFVLLAVFCTYLVLHVNSARRGWAFERRMPIMDIFKDGQWNPTSVPDPEKIDVWMTFKYVNVVFGFDDAFLKDALKITDPAYPNLPIGRYLKKNGIDRTKFLEDIRRTVKENWKPKTAK